MTSWPAKWLATHDVLGFRIAVDLRTTAKDVKLIVRDTEWDEFRVA